MGNARDVLESDFGLDLIGCLLEQASAISPDGTFIVGNGRNPMGENEGRIAHVHSMQGCTLGDLSGDGLVSLDDLGDFVRTVLQPCLATETELCAVDLNEGGRVNGLDAQIFTSMLLP